MSFGYGAQNHVIHGPYGCTLRVDGRHYALGEPEMLIGAAHASQCIGDVLEFPWGSWAVTAYSNRETTIRKVLQ
jgi:hypothetical protein